MRPIYIKIVYIFIKGIICLFNCCILTLKIINLKFIIFISYEKIVKTYKNLIFIDNMFLIHLRTILSFSN